MRQFILIAAFILTAATAQAGSMRSLTLASNDPPPVAAETPKTSEKTDAATGQPAEAPKFVERPAAVEPSAEAPKVETKTVAEKNVDTPKAGKPKRKRMSTEARVIYELHRHGIYW